MHWSAVSFCSRKKISNLVQDIALSNGKRTCGETKSLKVLFCLSILNSLFSFYYQGSHYQTFDKELSFFKFEHLVLEPSSQKKTLIKFI